MVTSREVVLEAVLIRFATGDDEAALEALAELDSAVCPAGPILIAECRGRPVAALGLGSGDAIADPFVPTADVVELLQLRARHL